MKHDSITMDIRDFIISPNRKEILEVFNLLKIKDPTLPKEKGSFDERALRCWQFMAGISKSVSSDAIVSGNGRHSDASTKVIRYTPDQEPRGGSFADFWQLPTETIARKEGDCEDLAILLASLMIGTGISPYCVRTAIGHYSQFNGKISSNLQAHAWVVYKTELGPWCLIDPTWDSAMYTKTWHLADNCDDGIVDAVKPEIRHRYVPWYVFNNDHAWEVYALKQQVSFRADEPREYSICN